LVVTTAAERQAAHEAARAKHPLRNHPRFRLATPERRTTPQVTVTGSPRWVPGGHAGDALACAGLRQRDDDDHSGLLSESHPLSALFAPIPVPPGTAECEACGSPIESHPLKRFCSNSCRLKARYDRVHRGAVEPVQIVGPIPVIADRGELVERNT
jgi:hypothetical protein